MDEQVLLQDGDVRIIERGRGPEIKGTRVTVYDILDYHTRGRHHTYIAAVLKLSTAQVLAALRYVDGHKDEVMARYQRMLEFAARGNPPEIQAKLDASRARFLEKLAERQRSRADAAGDRTNGNGADGRRQH
jgi:uncharacterized protein (DUF433 family)